VRRLTSFTCGEDMLAATIDDAPARTGLLIVTGGSEVRTGAHRGLEQLALAVSRAGYPAFRFDRRGVGDSEGEDPGFAGSAPDIAAAVGAFRALRPDLHRIVGFGLCDGATALALHHRAAGIEALLLANPWVVEPQAGLPPPAAIRRRYVERLLSLDGWRRLLCGGIDYRATLRGVRSLAAQREAALADAMANALGKSDSPITLILASGDATAIAFADEWRKPAFARIRARRDVAVATLDTASHSFAGGDEPEQLATLCIEALDALSTRLAAA